MAGILIGYGVLLAGLGFLTLRSGLESRSVMIASGVGGGLIVLAGLLALTGYRRRLWAIIANTAVILILLNELVRAWLSFGGEAAPPIMVRVGITVMFVLSVGMSMYLLHGERPPDFYKTAGQSRS